MRGFHVIGAVSDLSHDLPLLTKRMKYGLAQSKIGSKLELAGQIDAWRAKSDGCCSSLRSGAAPQTTWLDHLPISGSVSTNAIMSCKGR